MTWTNGVSLSGPNSWSGTQNFASASVTLPSGIVSPSNLSTGGPSWNTSGTLTVTQVNSTGTGTNTYSGAIQTTGSGYSIAQGGQCGVYMGTSNSCGWVFNAPGNVMWMQIGGNTKAELDVSANFKIYGEGYKPTGGVWATGSDIKLKKNIQPYKLTLADLLTLNPVTFQYNGANAMAPDDGRIITGLIAQDVLETPFKDCVKEFVIPAVEGGEETPHGVTESIPGDEFLSLDSNSIWFAMINAFKELDAKNKELEARLAALEAKP